MRSALTMLGIVIGVGSVILLVSLGSGARAEITEGIQGLGSNLLIVVPYKLALTGSFQQQGAPQFAINKFTLKTVDDISRAIGRPEDVSPVLQRSLYISNGNKRYFANIYGSGPNEYSIRNLKTREGRFFTAAEVDTARKVIVIGNTVATALFGQQDPIGQFITIKGIKFTVIGIQEDKGRTLLIDQNAFSWIPITTSMAVFGSTNPNLILVKAENAKTVTSDIAKINKTLGKSLSSDEFSVITQSDILTFAQKITRILTYLLGGLAGISLLVGGIGIMNIMLVSVTERTREIGIRKAVGAKTRDILLQFIVEAVTLSLVGGIIGVLLAVAGASIYHAIFHLQTQITAWIILLAFIFSSMVGLFFGVYPARKASRLDPIESLRYE